MQHAARRRLRVVDPAAHVFCARLLFGWHVQLPAVGDDLQHAARRGLRELHDPAHVLDVGLVCGWHVQLHANRFGVLVRLQRWRLQRRPLCERHLQHAACGRLRRLDDAPHLQLAGQLLGRLLQLHFAELPLHPAGAHLRQREHATHLLVGRLLWRHVLLDTQRHELPLRVQRRRLQPRPLRQRHL